LEETNALKPPLFLAHGEDDSLVPVSWGKNTYSQLTAHGINGSFHSLPKTEHELSKAELKALYGWILQKLPVL
jgi:phospholipase/carboxylesterase